MHFLGTVIIFFMICSVSNLLYSSLFILSNSLGKAPYQWIMKEIPALEMFIIPFFGVTYHFSNAVSRRFGWLTFRIFIMLYDAALILVIVLSAYLYRSIR
ncbi:hypothetical protein ACFQPF_17420 [Fictibacillus iocasae]|uniref:Uncharacterized protein n=1 Tax=Fictibacillus iocasae TaxID=2715437 RepID=A0ABW2NVX2_9BACL